MDESIKNLKSTNDIWKNRETIEKNFLKMLKSIIPMMHNKLLVICSIDGRSISAHLDTEKIVFKRKNTDGKLRECDFNFKAKDLNIYFSSIKDCVNYQVNKNKTLKKDEKALNELLDILKA